jgi:ribosomal-protein-alanine N-acetyltransferase
VLAASECRPCGLLVAALAVRNAPRRWRGRGLGELLLVSLLDWGAAQKAQIATLEVRVSNHAAQALYQKYQFEIVSRQTGYYSDNNEDAYIMITPPFVVPSFQANLHQQRARLAVRLRAESGKEPIIE